MTLLRSPVWAFAALLLAAVLQGRVSHALQWHRAQPDFVLLTLACAGTLVGGSGGTFLGLWAGLLTAALVPDTLGTFLTSRTLAGALAGWLHRFVIRDSLVVPPLVVAVVTLAAEAVYALLAPGVAARHPRQWLYEVGGEALYNALFALPVYFLLRGLGLGHVPEDPFRLRS